MAKNPTKGFTLDQLKKASDKSQKEMVKNADILNKQNPETGGPNYEKIEEFDHAGADGYDGSVEKTQVSNGSVAQMASPLNAYVSTAGHFQRLQDNIARAFTPTKGSKTKAEKEEEFKGETKKVSKKLKETTGEGFEYKPFDSSGNYFKKTGQ